MNENEIVKSLLTLELMDTFESGGDFFKKQKKYKNILNKARIIILSSNNTMASLITYCLASLGVKKVSNISVSRKGNFKDMIKSYGLVIGCSKATLASMHLEINKACIERNTPWISAEFYTNEVVIGPTVLPGKSSCYNCYRQRLKENENIREPEYIVKAKDIAIGWDARVIGQSIANQISLEVVKVLTGIKEPMLVNRILTLTPLDPHGRFDEVIRKTTCVHCGIGSPIDKNNVVRIGDKKVAALTDRESIYQENGLRMAHSLETLKKMERLMGKVGIINEIEVRKVEGKSFSPYVHVISADPTGNNRGRDHFGKGLTVEQSKASALGEAIERYCAKEHGDEKSIIASYKEVKEYAINPEDFVLPFNAPVKSVENLNIEWTWGYSLTTNRSILVPSTLVYHPYRPPKGIGRVWGDGSNGLAAGNCLEEAILHGILEVIERDQHMIVEMSSLCTPDVDIKNSRNRYIRQILDQLKAAAIIPYVKNLTMDIKIPTFGVFLTHASPKSSREIDMFSYAVGTHLNPDVALLRALTEAVQLYPQVLSKWLKEDPGYKIEYRLQKGATTIQINRVPNVSSDNIKTDIGTCIDIIKGLGMETIIVDLTRPNIGFSVVRVLIPGLQPTVHSYPRRFSRRLFEVPKLLGYKNPAGKGIYNSEVSIPRVVGFGTTHSRGRVSLKQRFKFSDKIDFQGGDSEKPFPVKPKILSDFNIFFVNKNKVAFQSPHKSFIMKVKDEDGFKRLISRLDGRHTIPEIIRDVKS
jgi:bacteriocin biosynthesis cyclodehydratase domain-containing protein